MQTDILARELILIKADFLSVLCIFDGTHALQIIYKFE